MRTPQEEIESLRQQVDVLTHFLIAYQTRQIVPSFEFQATTVATYAGTQDGEKHGEVRIFVPDKFVGREFRVSL